MKFVFRVPDPNLFTSGGNVYNDRLMRALSDAGFQVVLHAEDQPPGPLSDLTLWDTLFLPSLLQQKNIHPPGIQALILHSDSAHLRQSLELLKQMGVVLITTGQYLYDQIIEQGFSKQDCLLLEPGGFQPVVQRVSAPDVPVNLAMVANLTKDKGVLSFFSQWPNTIPPDPTALHFHLYGDPSIDPGHAREILGICNSLEWKEVVTFHGIVPQVQLFQELAHCHALISVSRTETYGMAIRDARAAGLPVLALLGGNIPYLIEDGTDGKLYPDLTSMITDLISFSAHPVQSCHWLQGFSPRPLNIPSWKQQAEKLAIWMRRA
ncbi:MAG: glycosyltransferase [Saprospiraceae bacterium]|nr:glycosyltransferase [Saprospiraceae bacterium]